MKNRREKLEAIFEAAVALETDAQRCDYLERACPDLELRQEVVSLLEAMKNPDSLFDQSDNVSESTLNATPVLEQPGTVIDRYKLLQKVGEGGMGVVYMAEQTEPVTRKVALKIIKLGMDTRQVVARFEAERQALAMMDHPNIAKVLDAGATDTGRPYFVMELVRGVPITEYCDKNKLSTQERLELFMPVCQAIQHAHQKGVIHRDIKPSNVMVTLHDGNAVSKVIDFGIAKATNQKLTEKTLFTNYAQMIGTPAYMSPEQAEMSGLDVDTRTDVYSLGVLLYELMTGTTPFRSKELLSLGYGEMQKIIAEKEPPKPSTRLSTMQNEERTVVAKNRSMEVSALGRGFQGDLDWIVMKALEKDRTHRYETANGLVADIKRHLNNEPVSAAAPTFGYQLRKFYRRNRAYMRVAASMVGLLVVLGVMATSLAIRATSARRAEERARAAAEHAIAAEAEQRTTAEAERNRARSAEAETRRIAERNRLNLYAADMNLAHAAIKAGNFGRAEQLLQRHISQGDRDLRGWEWRYLWQHLQGGELRSLPAFDHHVHTVDYSADGQHLAIALYDGRIVVRNLGEPTFSEVLTSDQGDIAKCLYSPDGLFLYGFHKEGGPVLRWDAPTYRLQDSFEFPGSLESAYVRHLAVSPDGRRLAAYARCTEEGGRAAPWIAVWNTETTELAWARPAISGVMFIRNKGTLCFSADGGQLYVGELDGSIRRFNSGSGDLELHWPAHKNLAVTALAASADGKWIASGGGYGTDPIRLWDAETGKPIGLLEGHEQWISWLEFTQDGNHLASASADQTARIWDTETMTYQAVLKGHRDEIFSLSLSPDGSRLATGSKSGIVSIWPMRPPPEQLHYTGHPIREQRFHHSRDGNWLFAPNREGGYLRFDLEDLSGVETVPQIPAHDLLAASRASLNNRMYRVREVSGIPDGDMGLSYSPESKCLLSLNLGSKQLTVWRTDTWQRVAVGLSSTRIVNGAVSADGKYTVIGDTQGAISVFALTRDGQFLPLAEFNAHRDEISGLDLSTDGRLLATTSLTGSGAIWETETWSRLQTLRGHALAIHDVGFSSDSRRLLTSGNKDDAIKLWDTRSHQEVLTLGAEGNLFSNPMFLNRGQVLVATSWNNGQPVLHLWRAPTWEEIAAKEARKHIAKQSP